MKNLLLFVAMILGSSAFAQKTNDLIINLSTESTEAFIAAVPSTLRHVEPKVLSKDLNIVSLPYSDELLKYVASSDLVESYGRDQEITLRKKPNDEFYRGQWALSQINAEKAWDITTGGTFDGKHDVVIAVLDEGFDIEHEDLFGNIYTNLNEIPNNNIDDDENGYIDDVHGFNIETNDGNHILDDHGTAVTGIIGAKSNNTIGVSGIMWNVKMLPISKVSTQSEVIEAFQFIVNLRRTWNDTKGADGAFVVATNYSAGIDFAFGTDLQYKSWCDMYDLLGSVGILNAAATSNRGTNVDEKGDMPTTCPSEYLMAVTNIGKQGELVTAGYGPINIDIGAPGGTQETPASSIDLNNKYSPFNGTSCATPHIAGAIGLLYSLPCPEFTEMVYSAPQEAALTVRDAIYNGAKKNASLTNKTKTGRQLDLYGAIEELTTLCTDANAELTIKDVKFNTENNVRISYITKELSAPINLLISDVNGREIYVTKHVPTLGKGEILLKNIEFSDGIYYFSIYNEKTIKTKSVLVAK